MKFLFIRKFLWLILFTLVHLWFMVFNWKLFITMLNVNLGFGVARLPPFVVLFLTGFVILAIQSWTGYVNKLHRIIHGLQEELKRKKKDQPSKGNGPGVDEMMNATNMQSRTDGIPGTKGERKEEGNGSGMDTKNSIL